MIVTRLALPVRSPMPLIVPCTCVAPASTRGQRVGHGAAGVVVAVDAERDARQRFAHDRERRADLRRQRAAVGVAQHDPLGARVGGRAQAVERVARVEREAVEEVLGVEQHALAGLHEEGDRVGDHREVLLARDAHDLLDVQHARSCRRACRRARSDSASTRRPSSPAAACRGGGSCRRRRSRRRRAARPASSSNSSCSLGLDAGKPASIRSTPSSSSACTTRTFSSAVSVMPPPPMPSRRVAS